MTLYFTFTVLATFSHLLVQLLQRWFDQFPSFWRRLTTSSDFRHRTLKWCVRDYTSGSLSLLSILLVLAFWCAVYMKLAILFVPPSITYSTWVHGPATDLSWAWFGYMTSYDVWRHWHSFVILFHVFLNLCYRNTSVYKKQTRL